MISQEMAQRIVDSVAPIVGQYVGVMNDQGVVIASSYKDHVGRVNFIAKLVIAKPYEADVLGAVDKKILLEGIEYPPAVYLPVFFNNKVAAVIGVTGKPSEIMTTAKMVQLTAELLIWKRFAASNRIFKRMIMEELVTAIIEGKVLSNSIVSELNEMGIDYENFHYCTVVDVDSYDNETIAGNVAYLSNNFPQACIGMYENHLVIFTSKKVDFTENRPSSLPMINFYIGCRVDHWRDLIRSYNVAKALEIYKKDEPLCKYSDYKLQMATIMSYLDNPNLYTSDLKKYARMLRKESLSETYDAYIKYNGSISAMCESLYIHRNTIVYRLNKIKEITGFDVENIAENFRLYTLHLIYQILTVEEKDRLRKETKKK